MVGFSRKFFVKCTPGCYIHVMNWRLSRLTCCTRDERRGLNYAPSASSPINTLDGRADNIGLRLLCLPGGKSRRCCKNT